MRRPRVTLARKGRISSGRVGAAKRLQRTAPNATRGRARRQLVYGVDERPHVIHRRLRKDAVAQLEDVAGALGRLPEDRGGPAADLRSGGEQHRRVEVALDGDV